MYQPTKRRVAILVMRQCPAGSTVDWRCNKRFQNVTCLCNRTMKALSCSRIVRSLQRYNIWRV